MRIITGIDPAPTARCGRRTRPSTSIGNAACAASAQHKWVVRFLWYDRSGALSEGLFLVPSNIASPATIKVRGFHSKNYPQKVFLCSWSDNKKDTSEGQ